MSDVSEEPGDSRDIRPILAALRGQRAEFLPILRALRKDVMTLRTEVTTIRTEMMTRSDRLQHALTQQREADVVIFGAAEPAEPIAKVMREDNLGLGERITEGTVSEFPEKTGNVDVAANVDHIDVARPVLRRVVVRSGALGIVMGLAGVALAWFGEGGADSEVFGNSIPITNVGLGSIFCGLVLCLLVFRRMKKTLVDLRAMK